MKLVTGILTALGLMFFAVFISYAEDLNFQQFDNQWSEFSESLPADIAELLPDSLSSFSGTSEKLSMTAFLNRALEYLTAGIGTYGGYLLSLVAVLLMCAVFEVVKETFGVRSLHGAMSLAGNLSLALVIMTTQTRLIDYSVGFLNSLSRIATGTLPIFMSVFFASGNFTLATVHSGGFSVLIVIIERIFCGLLAPLLAMCFCFHFASAFSQSRYFDGIHSILKSIYTTLLAGIMSVFSFAFGAKEILASGMDNAVIRGTKFAVSSFVPIVTSVVSGSLSSVGAALSVLKNACGIAAIFIVALLMLPVIVSLLLNRFVLKLAAGIAGILGEKSQEKLLNDTASLNGYLISLVVCGAMLFVFFLALVVLTSLALR